MSIPVLLYGHECWTLIEVKTAGNCRNDEKRNEDIRITCNRCHYKKMLSK